MKSLKYEDDFGFDNEIKHSPGVESTYEEKWEGEAWTPFQEEKTIWDEIETQRDYPEKKCIEAGWGSHVNGILTIKIVFFVFIFLWIYIGMIALVFLTEPQTFSVIPVAVVLLTFPVVILAVLFGDKVWHSYSIRKWGDEVTGTVIGYENGMMLERNELWFITKPNYEQICLIVIEDLEGEWLIKYNLKTGERPFLMNQKIKILQYQDYYLIK